MENGASHSHGGARQSPHPQSVHLPPLTLQPGDCCKAAQSPGPPPHIKEGGRGSAGDMKKAGSSLPHRIAGCFWPVKALNRLKGSRVQGAVLGDGGQPPQQKGGPLTRGLTASPQCPGLPPNSSRISSRWASVPSQLSSFCFGLFFFLNLGIYDFHGYGFHSTSSVPILIFVVRALKEFLNKSGYFSF